MTNVFLIQRIPSSCGILDVTNHCIHPGEYFQCHTLGTTASHDGVCLHPDFVTAPKQVSPSDTTQAPGSSVLPAQRSMVHNRKALTTLNFIAIGHPSSFTSTAVTNGIFLAEPRPLLLLIVPTLIIHKMNITILDDNLLNNFKALLP